MVALADLEGRGDGGSEARIASHEKGKEAVELRLGSKPRLLHSLGYADALEREKGFQTAETKRLWYVAATRARDYLLWPESGLSLLDEGALG